MKRNTLRISICLRVAGFVLLTGLLPVLRAQTPPAEAPIPDNDTSAYHLALLDYKAGRFQEALNALDAPGATSVSSNFNIVILKSRILTELKRYNEAEKTLAPFLTPTGPIEIQMAMADLLLRKRDYNGATKFYNLALAAKPGDPDIMLMLVYSRIGASDLISAAKIASQLKPLDQANPSYYFARAALAQSTDKRQESENDIETARTMYGITVTERYLKTYIEVLSAPGKNSLMTPASTNATSTNTPPAAAKP